MMRSIPLLAAAALTLGGCLGTAEPLVKDRYAKLVNGTLPVPRILISATARPVPADPSGIGLLDMAPVAQAEMVKETKGAPPLRLRPPEEAGAVVTEDVLERRIVIALRPEFLLPPGTRLMAARIRIVPDNSRRWRFVKWDRLEKENEVVEVGKVSTESKTTASAELNLAVGGPVGTPRLGVERSRQVNEEVVVRDDFLQSAAIDGDGAAWIDQRVGGGRDLATNTQFDAMVGIDDPALLPTNRYIVPPLWENGKPVRAATVRIDSQIVIQPAPDDVQPVCGTVELTGWLRTILRGAHSYTEADDRIRIDQVTDTAPFLLAPAPIAPIYGLEAAGRPLMIARGGEDDVLSLGRLEDAVALRDWLGEVGPAAARLANATLFLGDGSGGRQAFDAATIRSLVPAVLNRTIIARARQAAMAGRCVVPPSQGGAGQTVARPDG